MLMSTVIMMMKMMIDDDDDESSQGTSKGTKIENTARPKHILVLWWQISSIHHIIQFLWLD